MPGERLLLPQMADAGLEVALAAARGVCFRGRLLRLKIGDARLAVTALDGFDMEFDVTGRVARQYAEKVAAKLFARGAAQAMTPPDVAQRMDARISSAVDRGEQLLQLAIVPQRVLNRGHPLARQRLVKKSFELGI